MNIVCKNTDVRFFANIGPRHFLDNAMGDEDLLASFEGGKNGTQKDHVVIPETIWKLGCEREHIL